MTHKILVTLNLLSPAQQEEIRVKTFKKGYTVDFATGEEALRLSENAEVLFSESLDCIRHARNLRWLQVPSAGVDPYLDKTLYQRPETVLTCASGAYGVTISEHVVMVLLEMMRKRMAYLAIVANHAWKRDLPIHAICGSRITLLGTGDIGTCCATRLSAFAPGRISGVNRSGRCPSPLFHEIVRSDDTPGLQALLARTDVLILSLPGTRENRHFLDPSLIACLPQDAFVINVGRGSTIDQEALLQRLRAGTLAGAALDVFENEPPAKEDLFLSLDNVTITPHMAGTTSDAFRHSPFLLSEKMIEALSHGE